MARGACSVVAYFAANGAGFAERAFKLESSRLALRKKYTDKTSKSVSPMVAARFAQIEATVTVLIDLQIRANTPLVP